MLVKSLEETLNGNTTVGGVAVLFLDLDDFNSSTTASPSHWRLASPVIRRAIAGCSPEGAIAVRLGGDEFALIFYGPKAQEQAERSAGELCSSGGAVPLSGYELHISASIGVAVNLLPIIHRGTPARRRTAMYVAKSRGKHGFQVFDKACTTGYRTFPPAG